LEGGRGGLLRAKKRAGEAGLASAPSILGTWRFPVDFLRTLGGSFGCFLSLFWAGCRARLDARVEPGALNAGQAWK